MNAPNFKKDTDKTQAVTTSISITVDQLSKVRLAKINLSLLVRYYLDKHLASEESKEGEAPKYEDM